MRFTLNPNELRGTFRSGFLHTLTLVLAAFKLFVISTAHAVTIFVDNGAAASGDGTSWLQAKKTITEGLAAAVEGDQVWVAEGTYWESITLKGGVALYGGFSGSETHLAERAPLLHSAIIDSHTTATNQASAVIMSNITNARLDGFLITGVVNRTSNQHGGGIDCDHVNNTNTVANCVISGNFSLIGGGILLRNYSSPLFENCTISGNSAADGGGIYLSSRCSPIIRNCIISGNKARGGAGVQSDGSSEPTFLNCVISDNDNSQEYLAGSGINASYTVILVNTILANNAPYAIKEYTDGVIQNCLLFNNGKGDFYYEEVYTGANQVNLNVRGASNNVDGDPLFVPDARGVWTAAPSYNPATHRTTLTDAAASFTPGALVGRLINVNTTQSMQSLILANTATSIEISGDLTAYEYAITVNVGDTYRIIDYHIRNGSAALDRGEVARAPATDFDADARPGSDGLVDIGIDEADSAFSPPTDAEPPVSRLDDLPDALTTAAFDVTYRASDAQSGLKSVELYYRKNGGLWTKYGVPYISSPINFNTASTGGDGRYEFYTIATDNSNNVEAVSATPDDSVLIVTGITGARIYVDADATGPEQGVSWTNAIHKVNAAMIVASTFSVPEIWVAEGVYSEAVAMKSYIALYGGFAGGETQLAERNIAAHPTIIDAGASRGGLAAYHAVEMDQVENSRLDGFTIRGGNAYPTRESYGGGIYCESLDNTNIIIHCTITGNRGEYGGGIGCWSASPVIIDCALVGNLGDRGGGFYCYYSSPSLTDCTISANEATGEAGGVYCDDNGAPVFNNCRINNNYSASDVGGVECYNTVRPVFNRCTFNGNTAQDDAGGLYIDYSPAVFNDCEINDNQAVSGNGGGIYFDSYTRARFTNCAINGNRALSGGGMYVDRGSNPVFTACVISGNAAESDGGAVYGYDSDGGFINCIISGNVAGEYGGALCGSYVTPEINSCTFSRNQSGLQGGGIYLFGDSSWPLIMNTIFEGHPDAAIYEADDYCNPTLRNCLFYNNHDGDYFDYYYDESNYEDIGTTLTGAVQINALAEAVGIVDGDPAFVMGATGAWTAAPSYDPVTSQTTLTDTSASFAPGALVGHLINPNTIQRMQAVITTHTATTVVARGDWTERVQEGDTYQLIDYHLQASSACIDTGTSHSTSPDTLNSASAPSTDVTGDPRPVDVPNRGQDGPMAGFDIGAYEYQRVDALFITPTAPVATFTGHKGGPFSPGEYVFTLKNEGAGPLNWTASASENWLDLTFLGGPLAPGTSATLGLSLNDNARALEIGIYTATLTMTNTTNGRSQIRRVELRVCKDYFTELFEANDNDLDFKTITFTPDGSPSFYSASLAPAVQFPTDPAGGSPITLSRGSTGQSLWSQVGASFPFYGTDRSYLMVNPNGCITFYDYNWQTHITLTNHFNVAQISAFFADLDPQAGGSVTYLELADRIVVTYENVPEFHTTNSNSFQVEMFFDGRIRITYLNIDAMGGLAGLSKGGGIPSDFIESDLTSYLSRMGFIRFQKSVFALTDQAQLSLSDADLRGQGRINTTVTTNGGDAETISQIESPPHSGIYHGAVNLSPEPVTQGNGKLEVADGQTITATYNDADDGTGAPAIATAQAMIDGQSPIITNVQITNITPEQATITFQTHEPASGLIRYGTARGDLGTTISVSDLLTEHQIVLTGLAQFTQYYFTVEATDLAGNRTVDNNGGQDYALRTSGRADLIVSHIIAPAVVYSKQPLDITWTVTNRGNRDATGGWIDRVYLSTDANEGNDQLMGSFEFSETLAAGQSTTRTQTIQIPLEMSGQRHLLIRTDADNTVDEGPGEANNVTVGASPFQILLIALPNLQVAEVTFNVAEVELGGKFQVNWTVHNAGSGATSASYWKDRVYLSVDPDLDVTDIAVGENGNTTYLNPGESYPNGALVTAHGVSEGDYYVLVKTDASNAVEEYPLEGDNVGRAAAKIHVNLPIPPDFIVSSVQAAETAFSGETFNLIYRVQNLGAWIYSAPLGWYDDVYLSTDTQYGADDRRIARLYHDGKNLAEPIDYTFNGAVVLPPDVHGPYYVFVVTDGTNLIGEWAFEGNNFNFDPQPMTIHLTPPPDLEVTNLARVGAGAVEAGHPFTITYSVANNGSSRTPNTSWTDSFYLSSTDRLTSASLLLADRAVSLPATSYAGNPGGLDVGSSYSQQVSLTIPANYANSYYVIAVADRGDVVFEVDNANNAISIPILIQSHPPDLAVTSISGDSAVISGGSIRMAWTVVNQGGGDTIIGTWFDQLYASANEVIGDQDDLKLGSLAHNGRLDPGLSYAATLNVAVPHEFDGPYNLYVVTDERNQVFEGLAGEDNNRSAFHRLTVARHTADLTLTSPTLTVENGRLRLGWTVLNIGDNRTNANYWHDALIISANDVFGDQDDRRLDGFPRPAGLDAGSSYTTSVIYELPADITADYYVFFETNHDRRVDESGITGNNFALGGRLTQALYGQLRTIPDLVVHGVVAPNDAISGQAIELSWTVRNLGDFIPHTGPFRPEYAQGRWIDRLYLSRDEVMDPSSDVYLGQVEIFANLLKDVTVHTPFYQEYTTTATLQLPQGLTGPFYVFVVTDRADQVREAGGEANNAGYDPEPMVLALAPPVDLVVGTFTVPPSLQGSGFFEFPYNVENHSDHPAEGSWWNQFYLSRDATFSPDDTRFGVEEHGLDDGVIPAHGTLGQRFMGVASPGILPGDYYVILRTDAFNHVIETDEGNNTGTSTNTTRFDLPRIDKVYEDGRIRIDTLVAMSERRSFCYRFNAQSSQTITIDATWLATVSTFWEERHNGVTVYVARERIPTPEDHDFAQEQLLISSPTRGQGQPLTLTAGAAGVYYLRFDVTNLDTPPPPGPPVEVGQYHPVQELCELRVSSGGSAVALRGASVEIDQTLSPTTRFDQVGSSSIFYYCLEAQEGETLAITPLWAPLLTHWLEPHTKTYRNALTSIQIAYGRIPTQFDYDLAEDWFLWSREEGSTSQTLIVPRAKAGNYYIRLDVRDPGRSSLHYYNEQLIDIENDERYSVVVSRLPFTVTSVAPVVAGNSGAVTFEVHATGFTSLSTAQILLDGQVVRKMSAIYLDEKDVTKALITFDMTGLAPGHYELSIASANGASDGEFIEVLHGGQPDIGARLAGPSSVWMMRNYLFYANYGNLGDVDGIAPLLIIENLDNIPFGRDGAALGNEPASMGQVMGISWDGPAGILRPNELGSIPLYYHTDPNDGHFQLRVITADDPRPLDFAQIESEVRPAAISDEEWARIRPRLLEMIGHTWGSYVRALAETATYLSERGMRTFCVREIFAMLYRRAQNPENPALTGFVVSQSDFMALANASVEAYGSDGLLVDAAYSEADRRYALDLPAGTYTLVAQAEDHARMIIEGVVISAGNLQSLNITLPLGAGISGRVTISGQPATSFSAVARRRGDPSFLQFIGRVAGNMYTLSGLPEGAYDLQITSPGHITRSVDGILIQQGEQVELPAVDLIPAAVISGTVSQSGVSIPFGELWIGVFSAETLIASSAVDQYGQYRISNLPQGDYVVKIGSIEDRAVSPSASVSLNTGQNLITNLTVLAGAVISGMVRDSTSHQPLTGICVQLVGATSLQATAYTDALGHYSFSALDRGEYTVLIPGGGSSASQSLSVLEIQGNQYVADLELPAVTKLEGRLMLTGDAPASYGSVLLVENGRGIVRAQTDSQGRYGFILQRGGTFDLLPSSADATFPPVQGVTVISGQTRAQDFMAGAGSLQVSISGTIDPGETRVYLQSLDSHLGPVAVDPNGTALFSHLAPGDYVVKAYGAQSHYGQTYLSLLEGEAKSVPLALSPVLRITGNVRMTGGGSLVSVGDVIFSEEGGSGRIYQTAIAREGNYTLDYLAPSTYTVAVLGPGLQRTVRTGLVISGMTTLDLEAAAATVLLHGRLIDQAGRPVPWAPVVVRDAGGTVCGTAQSGVDGMFTVEALPASGLGLLIAAGGYVEKELTGVTATSGLTILGDIALEAVASAVAGHEQDAASNLLEQAFIQLKNVNAYPYLDHLYELLYPQGQDFNSRQRLTDYSIKLPTGTISSCSSCLSQWMQLVIDVGTQNRTLNQLLTQEDLIRNERDRYYRSAEDPFYGAEIALTRLRFSDLSKIYGMRDLIKAGWYSHVPKAAQIVGDIEKRYKLEILDVLKMRMWQIENATTLENGVYMAELTESQDLNEIILVLLGMTKEFETPDSLNLQTLEGIELMAFNHAMLNIISSISDNVFKFSEKLKMMIDATNFCIAVIDTYEYWMYKFSEYRNIAEQSLINYQNCRQQNNCADGDDGDGDDGDGTGRQPPNPPSPPPGPPDGPDDDYDPQEIISRDPNDIIGPLGFGAEHWVNPNDTLPYLIRFENTPDATAAAMRVVITHRIDPDLDWRTFRLDDLGWGQTRVELATDKAFYQGRTPLPGTNYAVDVTTFIDVATGVATWIFQTVDPATGEPPADALAGFLPPNDSTGRGEGFVSYTVRPRRDAATGSLIQAQATIVFDINEPLDTPQIFNTLDALGPHSMINSATRNGTTNDFRLSWSGGDDSGSALVDYTIYLSTDGGPARPWLERTTLTEAWFTGQNGHTYGFFSSARDNAGNSEVLHGQPDIVIKLPPDAPANPSPPDGTADVSIDTALRCDPASAPCQYDFYVWTEGNSKPNAPTAADLSQPTLSPPDLLNYNTCYFWQVVVHNTSGHTEGPVWTFTTPQRAMGTVVVQVAPETAAWILVHEDGHQYQGTGSTMLANVPAGGLTMNWHPLEGYTMTQSNPDLRILNGGATVTFWGIYYSTSSDHSRYAAFILRYLLGLDTNPEGLDRNGDQRIDIADLVYTMESIPPAIPSQPNPVDGATSILATAKLYWNPSLGAQAYDVYLWPSTASQPTSPTATRLPGNSYDPPGSLDHNMTYRWQVVAHSEHATSTGPTWSFTTTPNPPLRVISPNGGEIWKAGSVVSIHWKSDVNIAGTAVRLELWQDNHIINNLGDDWAESGENTKTVTVPSLPAGSNYKVRATSYWLEQVDGGTDAWDESDASIQIIE